MLLLNANKTIFISVKWQGAQAFLSSKVVKRGLRLSVVTSVALRQAVPPQYVTSVHVRVAFPRRKLLKLF